jgi:hypothetical protein
MELPWASIGTSMVIVIYEAGDVGLAADRPSSKRTRGDRADAGIRLFEGRCIDEIEVVGPKTDRQGFGLRGVSSASDCESHSVGVAAATESGWMQA